MNLLMHGEVIPFLFGLSTGLLAALLGWVLVECLKTWRGRSQVLSLSRPLPRPNQFRVRGVKTYP